MTDISNKFVVVTLTHGEAKIWATGIDKGQKPEKIHVPASGNHHHFRTDPKLSNATKESTQVITYFNEICAAVSSENEILLIGHGAGKASEMLHFIQFAERKHPEVAKKIVDAIEADVIALTEPQILALARTWFEHYR